MDLAAQPTQVMSTKGAKPMAALERLRVMFESDPQSRQEWRAQAKVAAILGSCPRTLNSFKSGIRNRAEFIAIAHGEEQALVRTFPPQIDDMLAWSNTFRSDCS